MSFDDFDPFNDRLLRDIRNTLSEAFVDSHCLTFITNQNVLTKDWKI